MSFDNKCLKFPENEFKSKCSMTAKTTTKPRMRMETKTSYGKKCRIEENGKKVWQIKNAERIKGRENFDELRTKGGEKLIDGIKEKRTIQASN